MSDDEYEIPLQDQRVFGAGLKRKRIRFVPSTTSSADNPQQPATDSLSVSDRYLSLVLSKPTVSDPATPITTPASSSPSSPSGTNPLPESPSTLPTTLCEICSLPLLASSSAEPSSHPHEATLAHQVSLAHSHPPSHIDRSRFGLRCLQTSGWDPDSRTGLGKDGQGIRIPLKPTPKHDKLGLGLVLPDVNPVRSGVQGARRGTLSAGEVRRLATEDDRKKKRLQELFYRSEDLDRYLAAG